MTIFLSSKSGGGKPPFFSESVQNSSYISGKYYLASVSYSGLTSFTSYTTGNIYFVPFVPKKTHTFDRLAFRTNTSSGNVRLGVADSGTDGNPDNLIIDSGAVTISGAGIYETTISQSLSAGTKYWLVFTTSGTVGILSSVPTAASFITSPLSGSQDGFESYQITTDIFGVLIQTGFTYGALPATFTADSSAAIAPILFLRG